ncbi:TadE/TadG family type IV pilus assembly protein [Yoonia sp.]|uniref:TadE/TadG family type IV pilus assembly protein n=1 Tax=Yoonia sp. TaxID=2212373 RepID=UPI002FD9FC14
MRHVLTRFAKCERGTASIEFVIIFPVFFTFFLMTYESGMVSLQHVMLERGLDIAVRDVRIGSMLNPTQETLKARICEVAGIIPNCVSQIQLEMVQRDPRAWVNLSGSVECINRSLTVQPVVAFSNGGNNDMMVLRACVRIDPLLPTTGLGKAIVEANSNDAAGGSVALIAHSAFVIEPFNSTGS